MNTALAPTLPVSLDAFYVGMSSEEKLEILDRVENLRAKIKNHGKGFVEIGNELIALKRKLKHGEFLFWVKKELGITKRTAQNYMSAAEWAGENAEVLETMPDAVQDLLLSPGTPKSIRDEVVKEIAGGSVTTEAEVRKLKRNKSKKAPSAVTSISLSVTADGVEPKISHGEKVELENQEDHRTDDLIEMVKYARKQATVSPEAPYQEDSAILMKPAERDEGDIHVDVRIKHHVKELQRLMIYTAMENGASLKAIKPYLEPIEKMLQHVKDECRRLSEEPSVAKRA